MQAFCGFSFYLFTFLPLKYFVPLHPQTKITTKLWTTTRRIITIRKGGGHGGKAANPFAALFTFHCSLFISETKKGLAQ